MIVDCAVYDKERRQPGTLEFGDALEACRAGGKWVWLGLKDPTEEEFAGAAREFDLHELAVEDAINAHQRPKLEVYGDTLFIVLKSARYVDSEEIIEIGELQLFMHPNFIVTVRHGNAGALTEVRNRIDKSPALLRHGPAAVLYGVLDHVVDDYDVAAQGVETDIQEVEDEVFSPERSNPAARIYYLEREVLDFQRAVRPLQPAVDRLARGHFSSVPDALHEYFRDVHDHLLRTSGQIEGFRDLLGNALQANLTQVSVRQNDDMRKISAWVAIGVIPTAIAAIYGMNFDNMPELRWSLGYPAVMLVIAIACAALYLRFKRAGWL